MSRRKGLDPQRLRRAVFLDVKQDGDGAWIVEGEHAHRVTNWHGQWSCSCADRAYRKAGCKHLLCVLLSMGNPVVLRALRKIVTPPKAS